MNRQVDEQKRGKQTNGQTGGQTKKGQTDKQTDPLTRRLLYRSKDVRTDRLSYVFCHFLFLKNNALNSFENDLKTFDLS